MSILALGRKQKKRKFPNKDRNKAKEENSQSRLEESKKKKEKLSIKDRNKTKYTERFLDQTISEQYKIFTSKQEKKENHDVKRSPPFDCQPKSYVSVTFSPRTKQKQKRIRSKTFKAKVPTK